MSNTPTPTQLNMEEVKLLREILRAQLEDGARGYGLVRFTARDVQPPSTEYLTRDSYLQINIFPTGTANVVTVAFKILTPDGKISVSQFNYTGFTANAKNQYFPALTEGFLLSLSVTISGAATVHRGDTYVQVGVQFGLAAATPMYRLLVSGYVTTTAAIAWPEGNVVDSLTGPGLLNDAVISNPAAGADFIFNMAVANTRSWLHSFTATLVTSATAGNRQPQFTLKDAAGNVLWTLGTGAAQVASTTQVYNLGEAATIAQDVNKNVVITLPSEVYLYGAWTLASTTANIQAADQWSNVRAVFESWLEV
jgi:hypothetical protein